MHSLAQEGVILSLSFYFRAAVLAVQSLVKEGVNLSRFCYFRGQAWTASLAKEGVIWSPFCYSALALAVQQPGKRGCQLEPVLLFPGSGLDH